MAVQLYGEDPNVQLMDYPPAAGRAHCSPWRAYVYADDSDNTAVLDLITELGRGELDMIAFTGKPQVKRLLSVANAHHRLAGITRWHRNNTGGRSGAGGG